MHREKVVIQNLCKVPTSFPLAHAKSNPGAVSESNAALLIGVVVAVVVAGAFHSPACQLSARAEPHLGFR
jgi:hypothetical protein